MSDLQSVPLPEHPYHHQMWTYEEREAIRAYGDARAAAEQQATEVRGIFYGLGPLATERNMSKQSDAKKQQGYRAQAACCKNCKNFSSEMVPLNRWEGDPYEEEKNKRCDVGGFAVQSTGHCTLFAWRA